ncbi:MAG: hypothetical protein ACYTEQ_09540 [Planctomycetota bacterium]
MLQDDALYAVEFAISHGLNPVGDISLWYIGGKLIVSIYWRILKGWAEMVAPFRTEFFDMTEDERNRHGLEPGDIGVVCYNILDSDQGYYHKLLLTTIQNGNLSLSEANRQIIPLVAKGSGIGIVLKKEMQKADGKPIAPPKGRSWHWRGETRSFRDAVGRSHGNPTPAQVRVYAEGKGIGVTSADLPVLADPIMSELSRPEQRRYLELNAALQENEAKWEAMEPEDLHAQSQAHINLMRGTIEDEETALGEEPDREEISEGVIEEDPPAPPADNEVKRHARIMGGFDWGNASKQLAKACPEYRLENGKPDMTKILTDAWDQGFKQIHGGNFADMLARLSDTTTPPTEGSNEQE